MSTILLADDDQLLRLILRERLERAGHEVIECGDGFAAIEIAMDERPECLVLDVMMPLARGLEVVRQVRRQDDWNPGIVMVSARTRVTDRLNALEAGADVYLEKPVAPDALVEAVARVTVDRTPTRIVDLLGPVWATLATERLLRGAEAGAWAGRAAAVRRLFADHMVAALGRREPQLPAGPVALRIVWERLLRGLVGDGADPTVPVARDIVVPDVRSLVAATAPLGTPDATQAHVWSRVLGQALTGGDHTAQAAARLQDRTAAALRHVLGIDAEVTRMWAQSLERILGRGNAMAAGLHSLERSFGERLGDVLGIHAVESDMWARALAVALGHRSPAAFTAARDIESHIDLALDAAMAHARRTRQDTGPVSGQMWSAAMAEILRGHRAGAVVLPDLRDIVGADAQLPGPIEVTR